jgi:hypothetical protein
VSKKSRRKKRRLKKKVKEKKRQENKARMFPAKILGDESSDGATIT